MKLSVLANLYGAKTLDETLKILTGLGVHTVEIGAGGYPGKAHCNPAELLADSKKLDEFVATFQKYDVEYLLTFMENVVNSYIRSRCRLSDGREGDIIYINREKLSHPIVQCGTEYVNLAETPGLHIAEIL